MFVSGTVTEASILYLTVVDVFARSTVRIGNHRIVHPLTHPPTHLPDPEWSVQLAVLSEDTTQITKSFVSLIPSPPNPMAYFF